MMDKDNLFDKNDQRIESRCCSELLLFGSRFVPRAAAGYALSDRGKPLVWLQ